MFPDSKVAKTFQCGEKKMSYLKTFGLAPHFKDLLVSHVKSQDEFVLLFYESLNKKNQKKQMDLHVRLWDSDTIVIRFYDSEFTGHATAEDMMTVFESFTEGLTRKGILQISMDGPNVNWKLYSMLQKELQVECSTSLLNVGSCGLHIVHGAYKKGIDSTDWNLSSILSAFHRLFKDSPARRDNYCTILDEDSPLMPLKHCPTRWVENVIVLERALELLPNMKAFVKAVQKKAIPNPKTKTCDTVKEACVDLLLPVKLLFAITVAKQVEPFLVKYQSDKPMLPFLVSDLFQMLKGLMERLVKQEPLKKLTTPDKLTRFDVADNDSHKRFDLIDIGFSANKKLKELMNKTKVSERQLMELRMACKSCLQKRVASILEKAPIKYPLAGNLACLNPIKIAANKELCLARFKRVLGALVEANRLKETECDSIAQQYSQFIDDEVCKSKSDFSAFDAENSRLDIFFYERLKDAKELSKLWQVIKKLLLLSHGQAAVERGFSINRQIEVENLSENGYKAQRLINDHLRTVGGIKEVVIHKTLLTSVSMARVRYQTHLEEQKKLKQSFEESKKRKSLENELSDLKAKRKRLAMDAKALEDSADDLSVKAEKKRDISLTGYSI